MNLTLTEQLLILAAYLAGSIPFGLILYKLFKKDDLRKHGSGNIGATNVARNAGAVLGVITLILDILKGFLPIVVAKMLGVTVDSWGLTFIAVAAIFGHMFPIWLKFKGGKGVATALGVFLGISWQSTLVAIVAFFLAFSIFKIVSLCSLIAVTVYVLAAFLYGPIMGIPFNLQLAALVVGLLIFLKHSENIVRLVKGEEKKLFGKK